MTKHKEYKSVSEFPLHTEKLSRQELEEAYQNIRQNYRSLTSSRGQLVRRQNEAKENLVAFQQKLKQTTTTLEADKIHRYPRRKDTSNAPTVVKFNNCC